MKDLYHMKLILDALKQESTCISRQTSAIIASKDGTIIGTGWNGKPRKTDHCTKKTCVRRNSKSGEDLDKCPGNHSELNAIINSAREGIRLKDTVIYCSHKPCLKCAGAIINAGIKSVFYWEDYPSEESVDLLVEGGVCVFPIVEMLQPYSDEEKGEVVKDDG